MLPLSVVYLVYPAWLCEHLLSVMHLFCCFSGLLVVEEGYDELRVVRHS